MTWLQRYRIRNYMRDSVWVVPMIWAFSAIAIHRLLWLLDLRTRWQFLGYTPESARGVVGTISSSMLNFMVFLLTMLLITVQIAAGQLTPRVIPTFFRDRVVRSCLGVFVFTYVFSVSVQGRIGDSVPQLLVLLIIILSVASIGAFLYLVGYTGTSLRPVSIYTRLAAAGARTIGQVYPVPEGTAEAASERDLFQGAGPSGTIRNQGAPGYLLAFDEAGLTEAARRTNCVIRISPQVGDFIAPGDPLFLLSGGEEGMEERDLMQCVAIGPARTVEQDPELAFRNIVDIAIRALSPAVNDPTTAVLGIDQIHRLLHMVGTRDLGDGMVRDRDGQVRLVFPTPDWEDFVRLGVSEIRLYGAASIQVMRRLRAMLENLIDLLPSHRHAALREQLTLLESAVSRGFADREDRDAAAGGDYKGIGGSRL